MDVQAQASVKKLVDEYGSDNIVVLLGSPDADSADIFTETLTVGDPTYAGPLAGVSLKLHVYHILENQMKEEIPEDVYQEQVGLMELTLDKDKIVSTMENARATYIG